MSTLDLALDSIGVGRPLGDGRRWTRADFAAALGIPASDLSPSRAGTARQERLIVACRWAAMVLGGEVPPEWKEREEVRGLAVRVLRAWCAANGIGDDILGLMGFCRRWGVDYSAFVARRTMDQIGAALAAESWAGVLLLVRS